MNPRLNYANQYITYTLSIYTEALLVLSSTISFNNHCFYGRH